MTRPDDIPQDVWDRARDAVFDFDCDWTADGRRRGDQQERDATLLVARAILAERERWKPAAIYFERYCQDEADDAENCVCGEKQHEDAKAFAAVIRGGSA